MNTNTPSVIGFLGLGLIGGSIAKSIKKTFPDCTLIGYDTNESALNMAHTEGTLDIITTISADSAFSQCDCIFLCAPVHFNIKNLSLLKPLIKDTCILTDVGSVKSDIAKAVKELSLSHTFIGGHPMVGSECSGFEAATDHLIENAYYFLTPSQDVPDEKITILQNFIAALGAIPIIYSPEDHDRTTAYISHIPHVIAASLVNLVSHADQKDGMYRELAAGGFKDITRIASSSPTVWEHILLSNPEHIVHGLTEYVESLQQMISAINNGDSKYIYDFFKEAGDYRNSIPNHKTSAISQSFALFIDIPDEPGMIRNVTDILSTHGISLKNITITHNREEAPGALYIAFYHQRDLEHAKSILTNSGYTIFNN